jgi:hypothetical protein
MSSTKLKTKVVYQPMDVDKYDSKVINLFLPIEKIINTSGGYRYIEKFKNLSHHDFKQEEIDFVCDCYHSGIYSIIGVTNIHGERRLTITGIRDRYQLDAEVIRRWIVTYKRKLRLLKEMATDAKAKGNEYIYIYNVSYVTMSRDYNLHSFRAISCVQFSAFVNEEKGNGS